MGDRCHTHKARACQKCAGDAGVHPGIREQWREDFSSEIVRCSWSEEAHLAFLDALDTAEADARRWKQIAKNFSEDCTVLEREVERLAGVVAKVRELHQDGGGSQGFFPGDRGYGVRDHCCTECGSFGEYGVEWPCWTVRTLDQADPS